MTTRLQAEIGGTSSEGATAVRGRSSSGHVAAQESSIEAHHTPRNNLNIKYLALLQLVGQIVNGNADEAQRREDDDAFPFELVVHEAEMEVEEVDSPQDSPDEFEEDIAEEVKDKSASEEEEEDEHQVFQFENPRDLEDPLRRRVPYEIHFPFREPPQEDAPMRMAQNPVDQEAIDDIDQGLIDRYHQGLVAADPHQRFVTPLTRAAREYLRAQVDYQERRATHHEGWTQFLEAVPEFGRARHYYIDERSRSIFNRCMEKRTSCRS